MPTERLSAAPAELVVDLGAVVANWRDLRAAHPSGPVGAVLKADGYGLGARPIAAALHAAGCRHFFVAILPEAQAIRDAVPGAMLAVLGGPLPGQEDAYLGAGIVPALGSLGDIALWSAAARRVGRPLDALVHIDTGMNRLGLSPAEVQALADDPGLLSGVRIAYAMTHLVSSELPHEPINALQRGRFDALRVKLPSAPTSLANSSGIFLGPAFGSDLARPGAALYGINPTPGRPNPMRQVATLRARVLALRDVGPGGTVGYNATWRAPERPPGPRRIATVGIGYADGLHRALSNRGRAFFDGAPLPLVGRVSMDLTTFDATGVPGIAIGSQLELLGPNQSPDNLAALAGTNGYEILTSLRGRLARRHLPA